VGSLTLVLMTLGPAAIAFNDITILVLITVIVAPISAIAFARSGAAWRDLGKGQFAVERELPPPRGIQQPQPSSEDAVRAAEVRQMLQASSYRRQLRGETPLDVEAEAARVLKATAPPALDEELRAEVRRLVIARNERRLRRGQAPLDVEAETRRQLADFIGSD